jgi:2-keto-4-pentenoate hydratase
MTNDRWRLAARALAEAQRSGERLQAFPSGTAPASVAGALAIQALCVHELGGTVAGWKVNSGPGGEPIWGAIFADDCFTSPADIPTRRMPLMGVEGEIAFRFHRDLPARRRPYERGEIEDAVTALAAIEIVNTRFADYASTSNLDRIADRMSNGGMVFGVPWPDWRNVDLGSLCVGLSRNGEALLARRGGHVRGDPLLPAIDFVRAVQSRKTLRTGQFITTGTFTGMIFGLVGQRFVIEFECFGEVSLAFS